MTCNFSAKPNVFLLYWLHTDGDIQYVMTLNMMYVGRIAPWTSLSLRWYNCGYLVVSPSIQTSCSLSISMLSSLLKWWWHFNIPCCFHERGSSNILLVLQIPLTHTALLNCNSEWDFGTKYVNSSRLNNIQYISAVSFRCGFGFGFGSGKTCDEDVGSDRNNLKGLHNDEPMTHNVHMHVHVKWHYNSLFER